jgi:serine/threonine protein kinase/tetratricopeptide (TPR) repeat protein
MIPEASEATGLEDRFHEVLAEYLEAVEAGADRETWFSRYPEMAGRLAEFIAAADQVDRYALPWRDSLRTPVSIPRQFGEYELLEELGRGAMGIVYKARQQNPDRVVALKMIHPGRLLSPDDVRRFRNEAEAAALLDHPGIIPIYAVGECDGQLFFTMKLIDGGNLAAFTRNLGTSSSGRARSELAAKMAQAIARAVHHAHQRGVLHRDLKPSNILVDAAGRPYVADFGLAKQLNANHDITLSGAMVGTPAYMAPEQAVPVPAVSPAREERTPRATTATDVYGIGAILYVLLTGRPPFQGPTPLQTLALVSEREPDSPLRIDPKLDVELVAICQKCLEKEPSHRYGSAEALADDLERWLAGEPVVARPVGQVQRAWRWCKRNPYAAGLCATVACLLVSVSLISSIAAFLIGGARDREESARTRAEENADKERTARLHAAEAEKQALLEKDRANAEAIASRQLADFMASLFQSSDPLGFEGLGFRTGDESGKKLLARDLVDRAAERIEEYHGPTLTRATLLDSLGNVYRSLGVFDKAEPMLKRAFAIRTEQLPSDHPDLASSQYHLAQFQHNRFELEQAEVLYRRALAIREKHFGTGHVLTADIKFHLAWLLNDRHRSEEAEPLLREVIEARTRAWGARHRQVAHARVVLAIVLMRIHKEAEALQITLANMDTSDMVQGTLAFHRANSYRSQRNWVESEKAYREMLAIARRALGDDHPITVAVLGDLAGMLRQKGDLPGSEVAIREMIERGNRIMPDHPHMIEARREYANALQAHRRYAEAETLFQDNLRLLQKRSPKNPDQIKSALEYLVRLYEAWNKPEEAARHRALLEDLKKPPAATPDSGARAK